MNSAYYSPRQPGFIFLPYNFEILCMCIRHINAPLHFYIMYNYVLVYEEFNKYEKRRNLNYPKEYREKDFKYIMDTICTDVK